MTGIGWGVYECRDPAYYLLYWPSLSILECRDSVARWKGMRGLAALIVYLQGKQWVIPLIKKSEKLASNWQVSTISTCTTFFPMSKSVRNLWARDLYRKKGSSEI